MNTNKIIYILLAFLGVTVAFSSCIHKNFEVPESICLDGTVSANTTIQELKNMWVDDTLKIDDSVIIEGYVVSSDMDGNFFKELVIQDESAAIGISIDASYLYAKFPLGQKVYVMCNDLYIHKDRGAIKIGSLYTEYGIVNFGRIQGEIIIDSHILKSCDKALVEPEVLALNQINDNNLYKLIKIENVQFKKDELGTTYADADNLESINHIIVDDNNRSLIVRVSGYAQFARDSLPTGNGTIVGVLEKYDDDYQFMIRNADDVDFNGERFAEPIFKDFEDDDLFSGGWTQYNVMGVSWTIAEYSGDKYLDASNFDSGNNTETETWFISPELDLSSSTSPFLRFDNAYNYSGPTLAVKYSPDYDGVGDPTTATWYGLNPNLSSGSFNWVSSGDVTISKTTKYIAFIYKGGSSDGSHWEVDDILIDDAGK